MRVARTMKFFLVGLAPLATAHAASPQPVAGIYDQYQVVTASSSVPPGLTTCNPVGTTLGGYFNYPGPAKAGAQNHGGIEDKSTGEMHMQVCDFPATPAAGANTWSGNGTCIDTFMTGSPTSYTLTFSWTIKYVDKNSFLATKKISYPTTGGTCTEDRNVANVRTGK